MDIIEMKERLKRLGYDMDKSDYDYYIRKFGEVEELGPFNKEMLEEKIFQFEDN